MEYTNGEKASIVIHAMLVKEASSGAGGLTLGAAILSSMRAGRLKPHEADELRGHYGLKPKGGVKSRAFGRGFVGSLVGGTLGAMAGIGLGRKAGRGAAILGGNIGAVGGGLGGALFHSRKYSPKRYKLLKSQGKI